MSALVSGNGAGQLMLSLEPGLAERFDSALDCVRAVVYSSHRPLKAIAAEMDTSVSTLSRKLAAHPDDPRHFTLADLEQYVCATGDTTPISWLVARYMQPAADRAGSRLSINWRLWPPCSVRSSGKPIHDRQWEGVSGQIARSAGLH